MNFRPFFRIVLIACTGLAVGCLTNALIDMETRLGLDNLFKLRGPRQTPKEIVIVAMDETSDKYFNLGWNFTEWRKYHAQLIKELKRQQVSLIIFDLQFIAEQPAYDPALADAIRSAGNILVTECLRNNNETREQCSRHHQPGQPSTNNQNPKQATANPWEKILPNRLIRAAVLDHAPFVLPDDVDNPIIREGWTYINNQTETPALPVLTWFYYLQKMGRLPGNLDITLPFSDWLSRQRRICIERLDESKYAYKNKSGLDLQIAKLFCDEDSHYLNFYGPPKTIRMLSYSDVYQGKISDLKGKVVFVGVAKQFGRLNKQDSFETPFTNVETGRMAGVEIMATEFANLLQESFIKPLPPFPVMLAYGLATSGILVMCPGLPGILLGILSSLVFAYVVQISFIQHGLWLPVTIPLFVQLPVSAIIALTWTIFDQKQRIKEITEENRRLIREFLEELKTSPAKSQVEVGLKKGSAKFVFGICLATDIKGYTSFAEQNPSELVYANLEDYFDLICKPVSANGGEIANITGDSLMAIWQNLPVAKQRSNACKAALEMEQAVDRFNKRSALGAFPTRIGLNEGGFTLGNFLLGERASANPVGDTVNTASRIESLNKLLGTQILSASALTSFQPDIFSRPLGSFCFVGRSEPVELVEIVGLKQDVSPSNAMIHNRFQTGLQFFRQGQWKDAHSIFKEILEHYGEDGPSRYYLRLASEYVDNPLLPWQGFVLLGTK